MRNTATYPRIQFPLMVDTLVYDRFLNEKVKKIATNYLKAFDRKINFRPHSGSFWNAAHLNLKLYSTTYKQNDNGYIKRTIFWLFHGIGYYKLGLKALEYAGNVSFTAVLFIAR